MTTMPAGGAFVWYAMHSADQGASADAVLSAVSVDARDPDGMKIAGDVELAYRARNTDYFVWRPTSPPPVGVSLELSITVDSDTFADCGWPIDFVSSVEVTSDDIPPPAFPGFTFETTYFQRESSDLEHLICCDGAYPTTVVGACNVETLEWDDGMCSSTSAVGQASATFTLDALDPAVAPFSIVEIVVDGEPTQGRYGTYDSGMRMGASSEIATQVTLALINLVDGSTTESEPYLNDAGRPEHLGEIVVERPHFGAACEEEPYICELDPRASAPGWDPQACRPVDESEAAPTNSGCRVGGSTDRLVWLLALGLLGLSRRSRRSFVA